MKSRHQWFIWLALLLLVGAGWSGVLGAAPVKGGKAPGVMAPAPGEEEQEEVPPPGFQGALDIRIQSGTGNLHPPGELVLSNPTGQTAGFDPRYHHTYQEIPGASYKRLVLPASPSIEAAALYLPNAVSGAYNLRVIGTDHGKYSLSMKGYDQDMSHADLLFTMLIQPGEVHHYLINYSNQGGALLHARRTRTRE